MSRGASNSDSRCRVPALAALSFTPDFLNIVVEVKAARLPHVMNVWWAVIRGTLL